MIDVLSETKEWLCVNKPSNCSSQTFVQKLKSKFQDKKFSCIYDLDEDISGPILLAKTLNARNFLKNAYGSDGFAFTFYAYGCQNKPCPESWKCDLSIAWDDQKKRSYPSKKNGKKSLTYFSVENNYGNYLKVKCLTHYLRKQQLQIHSHFSYFDILGDHLWVQNPKFIYLNDFKDSVKNPSHSPIFQGIHLILTQVKFDFEGNTISINPPLPNAWQLIEKTLMNYTKPA